MPVRLALALGWKRLSGKMDHQASVEDDHLPHRRPHRPATLSSAIARVESRLKTLGTLEGHFGDAETP